MSVCYPKAGLDFYYVGESVDKAPRGIYGAEDEPGEWWAGGLLHRFKHDGYDAKWRWLLDWRADLRRGRRAAADRLSKYVSDPREMIRNPEFQAPGWPIGGDPTEATRKSAHGAPQRLGRALES